MKILYYLPEIISIKSIIEEFFILYPCQDWSKILKIPSYRLHESVIQFLDGSF